MKKFSYIIKNKEGVHARPAGELIKTAGEFRANIELQAKGQTVSLKGGIFALMGLGLRSGEEIDVVCSGPDEAEAFAAVKAKVEELF
ncbi:MAG: HPr family phosphocarrier protein [Proteobacteria bacterium]|uniref:HPr family phosphocarrier protein n=1 Tax=Candidatus Avisuccinivibrio stercorigallinarum TaxID=2840704 RepID=A0A9D9DAE7_9GAMM|nr:HPr family phosphocarrier protein [Candidatus Avisuccinivibrio stercorigallinarum]